MSPPPVRRRTAAVRSAASLSPADSDAPEPAAPLTVGRLTDAIRDGLRGLFPRVWVEGEISGWKTVGSGHVYFTLKDDRAALSCVLWASGAARLARPPADGDRVELRGALEVFAARGQYQLIVSAVRPAGLGRLFAAFQEMKERLAAEGLFDPARKRRLPPFPRCVGLVTSPTGAAVRDILQVLGRRAPHIRVLLAPARVQGAGAAREVADGIALLNALPPPAAGADARRGPPARPDVIIVGRGGGAPEDLAAFNEEAVARAIAASAIPTVSAVGHETDTTIADFTADLRAPTPSAAAELVARDGAELRRQAEATRARLLAGVRARAGILRDAPHLRARLMATTPARAARLRDRLAGMMGRHGLQRPRQRLVEARLKLDESDRRAALALQAATGRATRRLERLAAQLSALDPTAVLSRGYAIVLDRATGRALRRSDDASPGQGLRLKLAGGDVDATVDGAGPETGEPILSAAGGSERSVRKPRKPRRPPPGSLPDDLFGDS